MTTGRKVLIVDDEYLFCKSLKTFLEMNGFTAFYAMSGDQAIEIFEAEKPDIMTLDLRMPGLTGFDVLEKIGNNGNTTIIAISAIDSVNLNDRLAKLGASAILYKPVDLSNLLNTIHVLRSIRREDN